MWEFLVDRYWDDRDLPPAGTAANVYGRTSRRAAGEDIAAQRQLITDDQRSVTAPWVHDPAPLTQSGESSSGVVAVIERAVIPVILVAPH